MTERLNFFLAGEKSPSFCPATTWCYRFLAIKLLYSRIQEGPGLILSQAPSWWQESPGGDTGNSTAGVVTLRVLRSLRGGKFSIMSESEELYFINKTPTVLYKWNDATCWLVMHIKCISIFYFKCLNVLLSNRVASLNSEPHGNNTDKPELIFPKLHVTFFLLLFHTTYFLINIL